MIPICNRQYLCIEETRYIPLHTYTRFHWLDLFKASQPMGYTNCLYPHPWYQHTKKFGKFTRFAIAMATRWWDIPMMALFPTLDSTDFTYVRHMKWILTNVKTVSWSGAVGWWLIQERWVGAATTDTRVVVGGSVVDGLVVDGLVVVGVTHTREGGGGADWCKGGLFRGGHLNAKNVLFWRLYIKKCTKKTWRILLEFCMRTCHTRSCVQWWCNCSWCSTDLTP